MKKRSMTRLQMWKETERPLTMGLDLGDRHSHLRVLDRQGDAVWTDRAATTRLAPSDQPGRPPPGDSDSGCPPASHYSTIVSGAFQRRSCCVQR